MNKLAEETFGQSSHFWYDGLPLYKEGTYAKELQLSEPLKTILLQVKADFHEKKPLNISGIYTEMNRHSDALHEKCAQIL